MLLPDSWAVHLWDMAIRWLAVYYFITARAQSPLCLPEVHTQAHVLMTVKYTMVSVTHQGARLTVLWAVPASRAGGVWD